MLLFLFSVFSTFSVLLGSLLWVIGVKPLLSRFFNLVFINDSVQNQNFEHEGFRIKGLRWSFFCKLEMQELSINLLLTSDTETTGWFKARVIAYAVYYGLWIAELFLILKIGKFKFAIRRIEKKQFVVKAEEVTLIRNTLSIALLVVLEGENPITIETVNITHKHGTFDINFHQPVELTLDILDLMLFNSFKTQEKSDDAILDALLNVFKLSVNLEPVDLVVRLVLPLIDVRESCFEGLEIHLNNLRLEFVLHKNWSIGATKCIVIATLGQFDERLDLFCKADRMLGQTLFEQGNQFELITMIDISVTNTHYTPSFESVRRRLSEICGTGFPITDAPPFLISIRASVVEAHLPFQFPLGALIEHVSMLFKAGLDLGKEKSNPLFLFLYTWAIKLRVDYIKFTMADDPFDAKLDRIYRSWTSFQNTREALIEEFWKHIRDWADIDSSDEGNKSDPLLSSVNVSPSGGSELSHGFRRLHQALFSTFRSRLQKRLVNENLFELSSKRVEAELCWHADFLGSLSSNPFKAFAKLLSILEGSDYLPVIENIDTNLGGMLECTLHDLSGHLRSGDKEQLPLIYIPICKVNGPLILCEEYPWGEEAAFPNTVKFSNVSIEVNRSAMPLKIYRVFKWIATSEDDKQCEMNFAPRTMLGPLAADLDRAFDLCSRPSMDQSPLLAVWDKLRYIFHGWQDEINFQCSTTIRCVFSKRDAYDLEGLPYAHTPADENSPQEALECTFPTGFVLSARTDSDGIISIIHLQIPSASLHLKEFHKQSFSRVLTAIFHQRKSTGFGIQHDLDLILLPACEFSVHVNLLGKDGSTCSHHQVKPRVLRPDQDSFEFFRTRSIKAKLIVDIKPRSPFQVNFLRQMEQWIARRFLRIQLDPLIKRGPVWTVPACVLGDYRDIDQKPRLPELFTAFSLSIRCTSLRQEGPSIIVSGFSWFGLRSFGGTKLVSDSGFLNMSWHKSNNEWFMYFGESELKDARISIVRDRASSNANHPLDMSTDPRMYEFEILNSSLLVYFFINEICFSNDKPTRDSQITELEARLEELESRIEHDSERMRECDPVKTPTAFTNVKATLTALIDRRDQVVAFLQANSVQDRRTSFHRFLINWVKLSWHEMLRDTLFKIVDEQLQATQRNKSCSSPLRNKLLEQLADTPVQEDPHQGRRSSDDRQESLQRDFFDQFLNEIESEGPVEAWGEENDGMDLRWPHELATIFTNLPFIPSIIEVDFIKPQFCFLNEMGAVTLIADRARIEHCGLLIENSLLGRRTKVEIGHAAFWVAFYNQKLSTWPPFHSDTAEDLPEMKRISEPATLVAVYDVTSEEYDVIRRARHQGDRRTPSAMLDGRDSITVSCAKLAINTNSANFQLVLNLIRYLLAYRDPIQVERSEQRETLVLAATRLAGRFVGFKRNIEKLVTELDKAEKAYLQSIDTQFMDQHFMNLLKIHNDLSLIVDALQNAREQWDRLSRRQTRLDLEVAVEFVQWSLLVMDDTGTRTIVLSDVSLSRMYDHWCSLEDGSETNRIAITSIQIANRLPSAFYTTILKPIADRDGRINVISAFWHLSLPVDGLDCYRQVQIDIAPLRVQLTHDIVGRLIRFFFPESSTPIEDETRSTAGSVHSSPEGKVATTTAATEPQGGRASPSSSILPDELVEQAKQLKQRSDTYAVFKHIIVHSTHHVFSYKVSTSPLMLS